MGNRIYAESDVVFQEKPTYPRFQDLDGGGSGRLEVLGYAGKFGKNHAWWCRCKCGNISRPFAWDITSERVKSCGCLQKETMREIRTSHGMTDHPLYHTWSGMRRRCFSEENESYPRYGGRGITVCSGWSRFDQFVADMGEKPFHDATIERKDNSLNYSCGHCPECVDKSWPANCEWETRLVQARNTRRNVNITIGGKTQCISMWAEDYDIHLSTIQRRVKRGWPWPEAITTPSRKKKKTHVADAS